MANKLFDNLMKVLSGAFQFNGTSGVSLELDFELPRGFVAKIHKVIFDFRSTTEDVEGLSGDILVRLLLGLMLDPDDTVTKSMPTNSVQHDMLADHEYELAFTAGVAGDVMMIHTQKLKIIDFTNLGIDVISARNMRLNGIAEGTNGVSATETIGKCDIYYTLEKINDNDILNLLDIL